MEKRLSTAKTQVWGLGVIPSHILSSISYLMAFLPCKSYQKLANNSTRVDRRPSIWRATALNVQTAVNNLSPEREKITRKETQGACVCVCSRLSVCVFLCVRERDERERKRMLIAS